MCSSRTLLEAHGIEYAPARDFTFLDVGVTILPLSLGVSRKRRIDPAAVGPELLPFWEMVV